MKAFAVSKPRTIDVKGYYRQYAPVDFNNIPVESLIVVLGGEGRVLKEMWASEKSALQAEPHKTKEADVTPKTEDNSEASDLENLCAFTESSLLPYAHFPRQLGRFSSKFVTSDSLHMHEEKSPLIMQVQALRQAKPDQNHFRIVLVNAFGTNLGDNLLGMTALRLAVAEMRQILPSLAIDILYGIDGNRANIELVAHDDFVEQTIFLGPTVQDFGRYDAYFDFSELINYPEYHNMPPVDWCLWWMGLEPNNFTPAQKRNKMHIPWQAWEKVQGLLKIALQNTAKASKKIMFNPKASVPLRSFPEDFAHEFALKLLNADADLLLVIDRPLKIKHKRLVDLSEHINSPELFKALIAQVDGLITVNSLASHVSDAVNVPCVQLCSVYPSEHYPYYPYMTHISIPEAQSLPAYKKCKVDETAWEEMHSSYEQAWKKISVTEILQALTSQMEKRQTEPEPASKLLFSAGVPTKPFIVQTAGYSKFKYEKSNEIWDFVQNRLQALSQSGLLKQGGRGILCGPSQSPLSISMAKTLGPEGCLELFEPRKLRAQLISSDALQHALHNINFHTVLPLQNDNDAKFLATDPYSEANPFAWGNLNKQVAVPTKTLDEYNFEYCQMLFMLSPMPSKMILDGAKKLLTTCRPILALAPVTQAEAAVACRSVQANYIFWAESARPDRQMDHLLILGIPAEKDIKITGFSRVDIQ